MCMEWSNLSILDLLIILKFVVQVDLIPEFLRNHHENPKVDLQSQHLKFVAWRHFPNSLILFNMLIILKFSANASQISYWILRYLIPYARYKIGINIANLSDMMSDTADSNSINHQPTLILFWDFNLRFFTPQRNGLACIAWFSTKANFLMAYTIPNESRFFLVCNQFLVHPSGDEIQPSIV